MTAAAKEFEPGDKVVNENPGFYEFWGIPNGTVFTVESHDNEYRHVVHLSDFKSPNWTGEYTPGFLDEKFVLADGEKKP